MLFENNNFLDLMLGTNMQNGSESMDLSEKFLRGNMFDAEFIPYKSMTYVKPKIKNDRERLLYKIMEESFEVIDYGLYLDVYPNDENILEKYNRETAHLYNLKKEYEEKYGPLCNTTGGYSTYKWIQSPWPFEKEDGMYV